MESIITFTKVALPFGWLGNMAPYPVTYGGKTWRTTEALFQALRFDDESIQEAIRQKTSPMAAKFVAKKHKASMVVEPMGAADLDNKRLVLALKLQVHPALGRQLLATEAARIIEDCSNRAKGSGLFWGAAPREGRWIGENWLGRLWEQLRASLRESGGA